MLDPKTDGKRLGFHEHVARVQHAERIAGTVPQGHDHVVGLQLLSAFQDHPLQLVALDEQVGDLLLEAYLASQVDDLLAHVLDHAGQAERTDVRLADEKDFLGGAGLDELVQDLAAMMLRVLDLAVELAVGKGPGAAFAELYVGLGVEHVLAPQAPGVLGALAHFLAALENDRLEAHLCEQQAGKDPAGPEADHQRSLRVTLGRMANHLVADIRRHVDVVIIGQTLEHARFVAQLQVDGVDELQLAVLLARIVAALEQGEVQQVGIGDAQALHDGRPQSVVGMIQGQLEFGDS